MRLSATIHAEHGVTDRSIQAVETGLRLTFGQTGLQMGVRAMKLSRSEMFPTLPSGQASDAILAGHPLWDGGGPNVWLTARDLNHYDPAVDSHDSRYGFSGHCKNECTMAASNGLSDTERAVVRMTSSLQTAGFCVDCLTDLKKFSRRVRAV